MLLKIESITALGNFVSLVFSRFKICSHSQKEIRMNKFRGRGNEAAAHGIFSFMNSAGVLLISNRSSIGSAEFFLLSVRPSVRPVS